jgi:hypothetical protein
VDERTFFVAADVGTTGLRVGAHVLVAGYYLLTHTVVGVVTRPVIRHVA